MDYNPNSFPTMDYQALHPILPQHGYHVIGKVAHHRIAVTLPIQPIWIAFTYSDNNS